ncbi:hypothetical protein [Streptomyces sp. ME19-01-6]|uniref:hypothetical protein n=1 Tax=Streptomyces sp. ME19-01-6 TaxID=3028686 RepID=UPI0029B2514F|nr:hypothetical protein [Streptomyces sp. ME19-01-6]MDX3230412.1 hypothetical protein [Streptomyces sp. ME19-01-6]
MPHAWKILNWFRRAGAPPHARTTAILLIAQGGTERGRGVSVARGRMHAGPFEPCQAYTIL